MGLFREVGRRVEQFKQDATEAAREEGDDEDDEAEVERADPGESRSDSDVDEVDEP
jgi:hypothetical protein